MYIFSKMICRQNSTNLWKVIHKLSSNTNFLASENCFYIEQEFVFPIVNHCRDRGLQSWFPQHRCACLLPLLALPLDSEWEAKSKARTTLGASGRGTGALRNFLLWGDKKNELNKDLPSNINIVRVGTLNSGDSQKEAPFWVPEQTL